MKLEPYLSDEIIPDLNNIVRDIEDEGDRCYLGSTNDADRLREIADWLETNFRRTPPASQSDEALVEEVRALALELLGPSYGESDTALIVQYFQTREAAAHAAGRAEMRKEAVGYAKNLALEFEKGGAYDESVVATSLAEGICALGDKP